MLYLHSAVNCSQTHKHTYLHSMYDILHIHHTTYIHPIPSHPHHTTALSLFSTVLFCFLLTSGHLINHQFSFFISFISIFSLSLFRCSSHSLFIPVRSKSKHQTVFISSPSCLSITHFFLYSYFPVTALLSLSLSPQD